MAYRFLEHATDALVEVEAPDTEGALRDAAEAVAAITLDPKTVREKEQRQVRARGKDADYLLFNWLEEVAYLMVPGGFAPRRFDVRLRGEGPYEASGTATGEPLDLGRHGFRVEVKAPTFHDMEVRAGEPAYMRFLLDL